MAVCDRRPVAAGPEGGRILTASMWRFDGRKDLVTTGDVPRGKIDKLRLGFGGALSCIILSRPTASSSDA